MIDRERLARVVTAARVKGQITSRELVNAILSDLRAQGYRIVPEVPTEAMIATARPRGVHIGTNMYALWFSSIEAKWTAMLNAHEETPNADG